MNSGNSYDNWRKASYSNGTGSCVETAGAGGTIAVRDTTNREAGALIFAAKAWAAFLNRL